MTEQATFEAVGSSRPVGSRLSRKVVEDWDGPPLRAVALLVRPDVALALPSMNHMRFWPFSSIMKRKLEKRLGDLPWQGQALPEYAALTLDESGTLHLLALQRGGGLLAEVKGELRQWPIEDVKVAIKSDGGWPWRVVEIEDDTEAYIVLTPFVLPSQRAAMKLIAESSGG